MDFRRSSTLFLILLLSTGLAFVTACGEEDPGQTENQQNQDDDQDNDEDDSCTIDADCDGADEVCQGGECVFDPGGNGGGVLEGGLADPTPTCGDEDTWIDGSAPERCSMDYADFDFGPGSHIDYLQIADDSCCVDFTGDGSFDNELDELAATIEGFMGDDASLNDTIQETIDEGDLNLVLEHDGLESIEAGAEFDVNFLFATEVTDDGAMIDSASFDEGAHPHALLPDAEIVETGDGTLEVHAGPGSVVLSISLGAVSDDLDIDLDLTISNATIVADIVDSDSSIEDGIVLENGKLGGLILFDEVLEAINKVASDCDCLGNPAAIFEDGEANCDFSDHEGEDGELMCTEEEELCEDLAEFCSFIPIAENFTDIDTNDDGETDAFSAGIEFAAGATVILGVAEDNDGNDGVDEDQNDQP